MPAKPQIKHTTFFLLIFVLTSFFCEGQKTERMFPFLDSITNVRLLDKTEVEVRSGCLVEHTTVGEKELQRIVNDSVLEKTTKKKEFLEAVLSDADLYHLHALAGEAIQGDKKLKLELQKNARNNYLKLRTIVTPEEDVFYSGGDFRELKPNKIDEIIRLIDNKETDAGTKKYFIEVLYSLTSNAHTGSMISNKLAKSDIADSLKQYSSRLFKSFKEYKPIYVHLAAISTWMEMDKNTAGLEALFKCNEPIMFFQILSQNPSTVLESKKLSNLKNQAILNIIHNAPPNSFFSDLRIFYLVQFLINGNYSIRFLDTIMTEGERNEYRKKLEGW